jgi:hypothetical protein
MRRHWRAGLGGLLLLPVAAWIALRIGLFTPFVNLAIKSQLKGRSPVEVRVGAFRSDVTSFIEVDDIVAVAPAGKVKLPLLTIANLRLEYTGWSALRGRVDWSEALRLARVRGLSVFLLRENGGR